MNEAEIQRAALRCLLSYKYAWLTPYKSLKNYFYINFKVRFRAHLEGLLDERTFRDHLVLFGVDSRQSDDEKDKNALMDRHRAELMPILLRLSKLQILYFLLILDLCLCFRILYGLLHTHVATRGKAKRLAILRFLANCLPEELGQFMQLLFGPLISLFGFIQLTFLVLSFMYIFYRIQFWSKWLNS